MESSVDFPPRQCPQTLCRTSLSQFLSDNRTQTYLENAKLKINKIEAMKNRPFDKIRIIRFDLSEISVLMTNLFLYLRVHQIQETNEK
jgi:hypothetical protein